MFNLSIVLTLALVCLQVSGSPLTVYHKIGKCFKNQKPFFNEFFPFKFEQFPVPYKSNKFKFIERCRNVTLSYLNNVIFDANSTCSDDAPVAVFNFTNTLPQFAVNGKLEGLFPGPFSGYAENVELDGVVSYAVAYKNVQLSMTVTVGKFWIYNIEGKTAFTDEQITNQLRNYFADDIIKNVIADKSGQLITAMINTDKKIAQLKRDCGIV